MATTTPPATPWYLDHGFWSAVITIVLGIYAVLVPGLAQLGIHLPVISGSAFYNVALTVLGGLGVHAAFTVNTTPTS